MLIKDVLQSYKGRVRYVSEDWGESKLAARFGIQKYPVVFVNDALLAKPEDFGGWGKNEGKYAPWRTPASHAKFKKDLTRLIDLALRGEAIAASSANAQPDLGLEINALPSFSMKDLNGQMIDPASLDGKVVIVEFWATWCVPCRSTLGWLGDLKRRYGDKIEVVAIALESDEASVRKMAEALPRSARVAIGSDATVAPFGTITSVPTMFVFDRKGKTVAGFYGAPPDLHQKAGRLLNSLVN